MKFKNALSRILVHICQAGLVLEVKSFKNLWTLKRLLSALCNLADFDLALDAVAGCGIGAKGCPNDAQDAQYG